MSQGCYEEIEHCFVLFTAAVFRGFLEDASDFRRDSMG